MEGMKRRSFLVYAATSLGVALDGALPNFARAQNPPQAAANLPSSNTSEFPQNSTVVLVHGAWADGSCWRNVILPLQQRGLQVVCAPIPLTSLTNDATALSWALERTNGPVVIVGHAYSGAVIAACGKTESNLWSISRRSRRMRARTVAKVFYRDTPHPEAPEVGSRFPWLYMDAGRWISPSGCPQGFCRSNKRLAAVQRPISIQCIQEAGPDPGVENEALVVFTRRRGSHD